jgi:hypothetical protein
MITGIHATFYAIHSKEMYQFLKDLLDFRDFDNVSNPTKFSANSGWRPGTQL